MRVNLAVRLALAAVVVVGLAGAVRAGDQPQKPTIAKLCTNCHKAEPGSIRGNFDSVAFKSKSIQVKVDEAVELFTFDENAIKLVNVPENNLRELKRGKEVRVEYTEKNGVKTASLLSAKPAIKVPAEKQMGTADVEKLVAMGPEKGKYLLIDARPAPRFMEGSIPTAVNIPFAAFDQNVDKLPKEKGALIVYFCAGVT
jgi:hypothetical protein